MDYKIQIKQESNCFKTWVERINENLPVNIKNNEIKGRHNMILSSYEDLYVEERDVLSSCFRTVYKILRLIDNTSFQYIDTWGAITAKYGVMEG